MAFVCALRKLTIKSYVLLSQPVARREGRRGGMRGTENEPSKWWGSLARSHTRAFMRMLRLLQSGEFRVEISAARLSLCPLRPRLSLARSDLDTGRSPRGKVAKWTNSGDRLEQVSRNGSCDELPRTCPAKSFAILSRGAWMCRVNPIAVWVCTRKLHSTASRIRWI